MLGVHYYAHSKHTSGPCLQAKSLCKRKGNIYSDIWVHQSALDKVIREGLAMQRRHCKLAWR